MKQYLDVLRDIREHGVRKPNRTGVDTIGVIGRQMRFDLSQGFPLVTTKKVHLKSILVELIWLIRGETGIKYLRERGVTIWDEWAYELYKKTKFEGDPLLNYQDYLNKVDTDLKFAECYGDLGPVYGKQWRRWPSADGLGVIDQLGEVVKRIKTDPNDRRLIVTAWNPADVRYMALPPCHAFYKFSVVEGRLNCHLFQRSCDMFLGVPFNIASYSALTILVAKITGLEAGEFIHTLDDAHIYVNHLAQVDLQLSREPRPLPRLIIKKDVKTLADVEKLEYADFELTGYKPHPGIKAEVAV